MKLYGTPGSPFVRKVRIVLEEKRIPHEYVIERPSTPGSRVPQLNPLGKIPVLQLADGRVIYDSVVIVEYLDGLIAGRKLIPEPLDARIEVKRWEALGDGIAEATVNINHEYREPPEKQRSAMWFAKQRAKIDRGLAVAAQDLGSDDYCYNNRFGLADIAIGYALGYLDYALAEVDWRKAHPTLAALHARLSERPSFSSTVQVEWKY